MPISRAKKVDKDQELKKFINQAGEPELPIADKTELWEKKTYRYDPEKIKRLEMLKVKSDKYIQELLDEALDLLFKKYDL